MSCSDTYKSLIVKGPVYFNANGGRPDNIHDLKQYRISGGKHITRTSKMLNSFSCRHSQSRYNSLCNHWH